MTRRITLAIVTDESGAKCAPECPNTEEMKGHWCDVFGAIHGRVRADACIAAEEAFRVAIHEESCKARGFSRIRSIPE